jgi:hypothetical protein
MPRMPRISRDVHGAPRAEPRIRKRSPVCVGGAQPGPAEACAARPRRVAGDAADLVARRPYRPVGGGAKYVRAGGYAQTGFGGRARRPCPRPALPRGPRCRSATPRPGVGEGCCRAPHRTANYPPELNRKILNLQSARIRLEKFTTHLPLARRAEFHFSFPLRTLAASRSRRVRLMLCDVRSFRRGSPGLSASA